MPGHRIILGIETSNPSAWTEAAPVMPGVALARVREGAVEPIGAEPVDPRAVHRDDLMPAIERLFAGAGLRPRDASAVAVSAGPGGYTAVRIAVTAAKMIAEATGAACIAVPSAAVVARRVDARDSFMVALASKGDSAWVTVFDRAGREMRAGLMTGADVPGLGVRTLVADRFLPGAMRQACAAAGIEIVEPIFDPLACIEASVALAPVDPVELSPIYPREPEAVRKWREDAHRRRPAPG